jgi:hypothetical protein
MKAQKGSRSTTTLSLTSAAGGGGWSMPRPGCFSPGNNSRHSFYKRLGGPQRQFVRLRKISPPSKIEPWTVQHVTTTLSRLTFTSTVFPYVFTVCKRTALPSLCPRGPSGIMLHTKAQLHTSGIILRSKIRHILE